jgi:aldehyde:ferredoxin oxidoreductase
MNVYGWTGNVLRVNLSAGSSFVEQLDLDLAEQYVGGLGLGAKYLYDEIDPAVDPLGPENKLLFATGPLTGTAAPAANRYVLVTKSPLTGAIANSSSAGDFSMAIKYAGYDMIIVEGRAADPVYLYIDDDSCEIRDAAGLWGLGTEVTEQAVIAATAPEAKACCIGPAGERLVRFACVMNDMGRAAGRSGVGAVMGSKNLKAVAVRGTNPVRVADPERFYETVVGCYKNLEDPYIDHFHKHGTPGVLQLVNSHGALPTKNFQFGVNERHEEISGQRLAETLSVRTRMGMGCPACPVACGRVSRVTTPEYAGVGAGPEYETVGMFGSSCYTNDLEAVTKANFICNEMGMDTITMGGSIACAMEMFERGLIPEDDIGFPLPFGDARAMVALVEMTARREGFGELLAEGGYRMAEHYGHPEYSMGVKKQELPSYDPRGLQSMGLAYATEPRGGCHIRGEAQDIDLYGVTHWRLTRDRGLTEALDPQRWDDKPELTADLQDFFRIIDSSGLCCFMFYLGLDEDQLRDLIEAATGIDMGGYQGLQRTGGRIFNLEVQFNRLAGLTAADDTLPPRFLEEPIPEGPAKGLVVELGTMLPAYYEHRGWDEEGNLRSEKAAALGLDEPGRNRCSTLSNHVSEPSGL